MLKHLLLASAHNDTYCVTSDVSIKVSLSLSCLYHPGELVNNIPRVVEWFHSHSADVPYLHMGSVIAED